MYERLWLFSRGIGEDSIRDIRHAIVGHLQAGLRALENRLGYWEKEHLVSAINAFEANVNSGNDTAWLRLSLVCLEKAFVPRTDRSEDERREQDEIDALTVRDIARMIDEAASRAP